MTIGPKMKAVRKLHGKTLQQVAGRIGVSIALLSTIENGLASASDSVLKKWLRVFFFDERTFIESDVRELTQ